MKTYIYFCGRYEIIKQEHKSETSLILFAIERY